MILGITGGMGSGKSLVSEILGHFAVPIYDSDRRAKQLMVSDEQVVGQIRDLFGSEAYLEDGSLNRSFMSAQVFQNQSLLQKLNGIVHPATGKDFVDWVANLQREGVKMVGKEAAILFESGAALACDQIVTVYAPMEVRIQRVIARDQTNRQAVTNRMNNQWPEWKKIRRSDWLIINDGAHLLIPQVVAMMKRFRDT